MHLPKILSLTFLSTLLSTNACASPASPDPVPTFSASDPLGPVLVTFYTEKNNGGNFVYDLKGSYSECCAIQLPNNANTKIKSVTLGGGTKGCKLYTEAGCKGEVKDVTKTDNDLKLRTILSVICQWTGK